MIKVTAIQTGTVQIKAAQATGKPGRSALGRKIDIFKDPKWLPPLPILAFLIEHPEGLFLIDTAQNSTPGYLPRWHPFFRYEVSVNVKTRPSSGPTLTKPSSGSLGGPRPLVGFGRRRGLRVQIGRF